MIFLDKAITETVNTSATPGVLEYLFTRIAIQYLEAKGISHDHLNDVVGSFEGALAEFQRRVVAPYEDKKIVENGDVYPPSLLPAMKIQEYGLETPK